MQFTFVTIKIWGNNKVEFLVQHGIYISDSFSQLTLKFLTLNSQQLFQISVADEAQVTTVQMAETSEQRNYESDVTKNWTDALLHQLQTVMIQWLHLLNSTLSQHNN